MKIFYQEYFDKLFYNLCKLKTKSTKGVKLIFGNHDIDDIVIPEKKFEELKILVRKQLSYLVILNGVLMIFGLVNSKSIIKLVYQRGSFTSIESGIVSSIKRSSSGGKM